MEHTVNLHPVPEAFPRHVGIIPDGGRRWSLKHGCSLKDAYIQTKHRLREFVGLLLDREIREISIYLSSIQNFRREPAELDSNLMLVESSLSNEISEIARLQCLRVVIAGNREILPKSLYNAILSIEKSTFSNTRGRLNLLIAYDPYQEIIQAIKATDDPVLFYRQMKITTPVDLVIRSGGAPLLSNFLPLQSAYARLFFFDKLFNELTIEDFEGVLNDFQRTIRKFGE